MSYTLMTWRNNQSTAINANNSNHIEQEISNAHNDIIEKYLFNQIK